MAFTDLIASAVQLIVPQPCFDIVFIEYDFFNMDCFKVALSKFLGYIIIIGSILVKLPQIIKMWRAKSGAGINMPSVMLELLAITATTAYAFRHAFPFTSYGDSVFLAIQTSAIAFLIMMFEWSSVQAITFLLSYGAMMAFLLMPLSPMSLIVTLQSLNIIIVVLSKMLQAYENLKNGSTGQLSAITLILIFLGSIARIFTSVQETGDSLIIAMYIIATICNGILTAQLAYYWNVDSSKAAARPKKD